MKTLVKFSDACQTHPAFFIGTEKEKKVPFGIAFFAMVSLFISFVRRTALGITVSAVAKLYYLSKHQKMPFKQVFSFL